MGTVKRYDARLVADVCGNKDVVMREAHDGLFVQHDDYAALEAALTALREKLETAENELAFRDFAQARASDIALNYGPYIEIQKALSSEIALHAAWTKRAYEAEAALTAAEQRAKELGEALREAAQSLRTISVQAGRVELMTDVVDIRGYANSRANVADAALAQPRTAQEQK